LVPIEKLDDFAGGMSKKIPDLKIKIFDPVHFQNLTNFTGKIIKN
jgi:hypothetical protein